MDQAIRPNSRGDFEIAIICALAIEADAVVALFDRHWDDDEERGNASPYDKAAGDAATYSAGRIGRHNVVVVHMPRDGKARAASVATYCRMSWASIKLALVVGICGAVPFIADHDGIIEIILGAVIISEAVIQYDLGRRLPDQFVRKDTLLDSLGRPSEEILGLLAKLKGVRDKKKLLAKTEGYLAKLREDADLKAEYPGVTHDTLLAADYHHLGHGKTCDAAGCSGELIKRDRLVNGKPRPSIHFGLIASGDTVIKSGKSRDTIAKKEGVIAFEMESAGLWGVFPCIVVKGVCDYADSHKAKGWQRYAAATAAACAKAFLEHWVPSPQVENRRPAVRGEVMGSTSQSTPKEPRCYLPLQKNRKFVGRTSILDTLKQKLFGNDDDVAERIAIVGLGGVGKTQVALQIAYWVKNNKPDWHVFWVPALSMASFDQACGAIAQMIWPDGDDKEDAKDLFRRYLESDASGRWLLIVDNADDKDVMEGKGEGICDFLPRSDRGRGRILFTTRVQEMAFRLAETEIADLSQMEDHEAIELLEKFFINCPSLLEDRKAVAELISVLTNLPLAIAQAAAYLTVTKVTVAEYLQLLQNTEQDMVELLEMEFADSTRYNTRHHGTSNAVAKTWVVSFEQIRKNEDAARLLRFIAQVEFKAIPRSMLPRAETAAKMFWAIGVLTGYIFLSLREDGTAYDMHRLVHLASRVWFKKQDLAGGLRRAALQHLRGIFSTDEWEERETMLQMLPHVLKAIEVNEERSWGEEERDLGSWAGEYLRQEGRTREAVQLLVRVVAGNERTLDETHPTRLLSQHNLSDAYRSDGRTKEAIALLKRVMAVCERTMTETDPYRLQSQHLLAQAYQAEGRLDEASALLEQVEAVHSTQLEIFPGQLKTQQQLASVYTATGRVKEAIPLLERMVADQERTLAETHPDLLSSQVQLAVAYRTVRRVEEAIKLLERVVAIEERTLEETHLSLLTSQQVLANTYIVDKQFDRGLHLLRAVINGAQKSQEVDHSFRVASERLFEWHLRDPRTALLWRGANAHSRVFL